MLLRAAKRLGVFTRPSLEWVVNEVGPGMTAADLDAAWDEAVRSGEITETGGLSQSVFGRDLIVYATHQHYQGDVRDLLYAGWDLMIAHPPCTHLSVSGARWFDEKRADGRQQAALSFFGQLLAAPIPRICVENPVSIVSSVFRKPDQIVQPWMFGHGETKATCLWLKGLPRLEPTNVVEGRENRVHRMPPSEDRGRLRSITYQGIADAMANQWAYEGGQSDEG